MLGYAGIQPPNDIVVYYAVGIFVSLLLLWVLIERHRFKGPPTGNEIAKRRVEIAKIEAQAGVR